jgi:hypothetical protein
VTPAWASLANLSVIRSITFTESLAVDGEQGLLPN